MSKIIKTSLEINDWFSSLNDEINIWITDPPYPFDNKNGSGRFDHTSGVDNMYDRMGWPDMEKLYSNMFDNTASGGVAYIFCNRDGLFKTRNLLDASGWKMRNLIVWDKLSMGMGYHWRNQVEYIFYVSKGSVKNYIKSSPNIFKYKKPRGKDSIPAIGYNPNGTSPKPYHIWSDILSQYDSDDLIIADPFGGSDPMSAAIKMNQDIEAKIKKAYINIYDT